MVGKILIVSLFYSLKAPLVFLTSRLPCFHKRILNYRIRNFGWKWLHFKQFPQSRKNISAHLRLFFDFSKKVNVRKGDGNILWNYKPLKLLF